MSTPRRHTAQVEQPSRAALAHHTVPVNAVPMTAKAAAPPRKSVDWARFGLSRPEKSNETQAQIRQVNYEEER